MRGKTEEMKGIDATYLPVSVSDTRTRAKVTIRSDTAMISKLYGITKQNQVKFGSGPLSVLLHSVLSTN